MINTEEESCEWGSRCFRNPKGESNCVRRGSLTNGTPIEDGEDYADMCESQYTAEGKCLTGPKLTKPSTHKTAEVGTLCEY